MARTGFFLRAFGALVVVLGVSFVSTQTAGAVSLVGTVAGTGDIGFNGDRAALKTNIFVRELVFAPNGELYFTDGESRIRRVTKRGTIETVAGTDDRRFNGDGAAREKIFARGGWCLTRPVVSCISAVDRGSVS